MSTELAKSIGTRVLAIVMAAYAIIAGCYNAWAIVCGDLSVLRFAMLVANILLAGLMVESIIRPDDPPYLRRILTRKRNGRCP